MKRSAILFFVLILPACSLFDNSDPREGSESAEACYSRVLGTMLDKTRNELAESDGLLVPTYTYDVTKMDLDDMKSLLVTGSDETAGSRGMASTNQSDAAVEAFMAQSVDENGAFFLGRDPALYRVRGEPRVFDEIIPTGCERQLPGMRLIAISWQPAPPSEQASPDDPDNENAN
ncbi:hypothetical protein [Erythrobacter sp. THAF29]|uniref:hypothetical protein n=1 Tax=Erythrobacter sp. THAF29 TaxID=2587851 RepID=UPI00126790B8|nr:hypothetical protein [Erythrobacter sp. THAF29]QFT77808.1 hypothetical protein FIU90_09700 [Erythrobacter sp. THAF29]